MNQQRKKLNEAKLLVIKIGSSTLTDGKGCLDLENLERIIAEINELVREGRQVILVTSGAVTTGSEALNLFGKLKTIPEKQAAAAVGQSILMRDYANYFSRFSLKVGQVLLTRDAISDRHRYINARNTIAALLSLGIIPIVNENDTVAVDEIKVGDNDNLAALVASMMGADLLINLTDTNGFYLESSCQGEVCDVIEKVTDEIKMAAGDNQNFVGTGGMITKIEAVEKAASAGIPVVIGYGRHAGFFADLFSGKKVGTLFLSQVDRLLARKRWLLHGLEAAGEIIIDQGAVLALKERGGSLLPVGVKEVRGEFEAGDSISILDLSKKEIGRGLSNYGFHDLIRIKGKRTEEIKEILGYDGAAEIIHRDNLILI